MCGIFGYKGVKQDTHSVLLHGLQRLEYRGYDSAGMVVIDREKVSQKHRAVGKVSSLVDKVKAHRSASLSDKVEKFKASSKMVSESSYGIAHTRWATHGGVTEDNCHPHTSNDGKVHLVHNGIVENYGKIRTKLEEQGFTFYSETDTEVIVNLIQHYREGDLVEAVHKAVEEIRGAYALLIVHEDNPGEIVAVRLGSPLMFGYKEDGEFYFSSDGQALSGYADKLIVLEDGDILHLKGNDYIITTGGKPTVRTVEELDQEALEASKGTYKHFMLKEIYEQPSIVKRIYKGRADFEQNKLWADAFHGLQHENYRHITFVACGTSYYSGRLASLWAEELMGVTTSVEIASEYENKRMHIQDDILHVFISQSGETADTISCLKLVKEQGGKTFGIVNVPGTTIARLTDSGLFTRAGTEIGVASTKAFTAQAVNMLLVILFMAKKRGLGYLQYKRIMRGLEQLPMHLDAVLDQSEYIRSVAEHMTEYKNMFFLGRWLQLPIAYEASLKLKEISYLHSEAYPLGELKHGPLALIDESVPSVLLMPHDDLYEKNLSSLQEIKARSGKILAVSDVNVPGADWQISIPETISELSPLITGVAGQLLAYHIADLLQRDIDKPRNLAKSVTVK